MQLNFAPLKTILNEIGLKNLRLIEFVKFRVVFNLVRGGEDPRLRGHRGILECPRRLSYTRLRPGILRLVKTPP